MLFNAVYEDALSILRHKAREEELVPSLQTWSAPFWCMRTASDAPTGKAKAHELQYVGDATGIMITHSPQKLVRHIYAYMALLQVTFAAFGLSINWGKGKTECSVISRRAGATKAMQCITRLDCQSGI